jgi:hypothetical protein
MVHQPFFSKVLSLGITPEIGRAIDNLERAKSMVTLGVMFNVRLVFNDLKISH